MKIKITVFITAIFSFAFFLSSCGPRLAQTPYGDREREWADYVKKAYPAWTPPKTMPPVSEKSIEPEEEVPVLEEEMEIVEIEEESFVPEPESAIETKPDTAGKSELYLVQKGDSLWKISKKFYNRGSDWKKILEANPEIKKDSKSLKPGMEIVIPQP